jgi:uncharacterized membrane protein YphA (DoxX/SURF4 family)
MDIRYAIIIFILMFIISGTTKVLSLGNSEGLRFSKKTNIDEGISKYIVFGAGLWELLASFLIIYGLFKGNMDLVRKGIYALMIFTATATLLFYTSPFKYKPFLSNLSVITGLYLVLNVCEVVNN